MLIFNVFFIHKDVLGFSLFFFDTSSRNLKKILVNPNNDKEILLYNLHLSYHFSFIYSFIL